ncbi:MAG TPA: PP2C family protein-serine/threonine phosphatase [Gaiellales bacterium]|nr:PP2C family protein-serine/threonine phosphatase [Gaiellales bacterium]
MDSHPTRTTLRDVPGGLDWPRRLLASGAVALLELAIALPFLFIDPATVRGIPGPLLIVVALAASYALGPVAGAALTALAVLLAVTIIGENEYFEPIVWIPTAVLCGVLGARVSRGEALRREVVAELQRGLVALSAAPRGGPLRVMTRYSPAESAQLLAADFYGVLETRDGGVAILIGDVSGHGPRAAAVASRLRASWRALITAEVPAERAVAVLNDLLLAEQRVATTFAFATACLATIDADRTAVSMVVAGHPGPVLVENGSALQLEVAAGPPLGVVQRRIWSTHRVDLAASPWTLVFYTDGLVEGRGPDGSRPFGIERLLPDLAQRGPLLRESDLDDVLATVEEANAGRMEDDIVILTVSPEGPVPEPQPSASTGGEQRGQANAGRPAD